MTIQKLITKGYLSSALEEMHKHAEKHSEKLENESILLQARFNSLETEIGRGTVPPNQARFRKNVIIQAALSLLEKLEIEEEETIESNQNQNTMLTLSISNVNQFIKDNIGNDFASKGKEIRNLIRSYEDDKLDYQGPEGGFDRDKSRIQEISQRWRNLLKEKEDSSFGNREKFHKEINGHLEKGEIVKAIKKMKLVKPSAEKWDSMIESMSQKEVDQFAKEITIEKIRLNLKSL